MTAKTVMSNHASAMKFEKVSRCSAIWKTVFSKAAHTSPFVSYEWFSAMCYHLLKDDPEVMICWNKTQPIGIIPGTVKKNTLTFLVDKRVTDLIDIIALPGYEEQVLEELASFITSNDLHLDISPLETESPLCRLLPSLVSDVNTEPADLCPILPLTSSWTGYLSGLSGKLRHELRRKLKKATDIEIKVLEPSHLDVFFKLMVSSGSGKKDFLQEKIRHFLTAIVDAFAANQWLRMRVAFLDSKPVAALFSFQMNDRIYLYNSGFDPDCFEFSPGIVIIGKDIMAAIDEGIKYYDFLRGDEDYKFRFGAEKRYTVRLTR